MHDNDKVVQVAYNLLGGIGRASTLIASPASTSCILVFFSGIPLRRYLSIPGPSPSGLSSEIGCEF
jgi:hypothetical protein